MSWRRLAQDRKWVDKPSNATSRVVQVLIKDGNNARSVIARPLPDPRSLVVIRSSASRSRVFAGVRRRDGTPGAVRVQVRGAAVLAGAEVAPRGVAWKRRVEGVRKRDLGVVEAGAVGIVHGVGQAANL